MSNTKPDQYRIDVLDERERAGSPEAYNNILASDQRLALIRQTKQERRELHALLKANGLGSIVRTKRQAQALAGNAKNLGFQHQLTIRELWNLSAFTL